MKKINIIIVIITLLISSLLASDIGEDWYTILGFSPDSPLTLTDQETFICAISLATISYTLAEFVFNNYENVDFYQIRMGMNKEYGWGLRDVWHQNLGLEQRVAGWFSLGAELNLQEFYDDSPNLSNNEKFGFGTGLMTYYRWYFLGDFFISPYFEYGTGIFYGFSKFPANGTKFTFNHSTQVGLEYTLRNQNKIRIGYGNFHQSNNGWLDRNPGHDGDGFSLSYSVRLK
jgi:hypothetical protein